MHDAPASSPADESPSSPLETTPSPPTPVVPASPTEDVVPGASPIESGEDSSAPVCPEDVPADEQSAEVSGECEDGQENDEKGIADINEGDEKDTQDNASSPKKTESPETEPEEEEGEELKKSSLAAGGPSDDIASPAPEESKEADDGGVLLGNLRDTEDISSSSEEGLLEDTSNSMEDISEPGSTEGLVEYLEAIVRKKEEPWRQEPKDSECPVHKERKTKHKKETCQHRKHRHHRRTNSNN
ncbi:hypothetical protein MRX96_017888 [Rhipicephalus microplus]